MILFTLTPLSQTKTKIRFFRASIGPHSSRKKTLGKSGNAKKNHNFCRFFRIFSTEKNSENHENPESGDV